MPKSRRREAAESAWHWVFAAMALAGAVYHERRRHTRDNRGYREYPGGRG